jgi:hypothetical protein
MYYDRSGVVASTDESARWLQTYGIDALLQGSFPNPTLRQTTLLSGAIMGARLRRQWLHCAATRIRRVRTCGRSSRASRPGSSMCSRVPTKGSRQALPRTSWPAFSAEVHFIEVGGEIGHMAFAYETEQWARNWSTLSPNPRSRSSNVMMRNPPLCDIARARVDRQQLTIRPCTPRPLFTAG